MPSLQRQISACLNAMFESDPAAEFEQLVGVPSGPLVGIRVLCASHKSVSEQTYCLAITDANAGALERTRVFMFALLSSPPRGSPEPTDRL